MPTCKMSDLVSIAGIHAAVLAIIIGIIAVYVVYMRTILEPMKTVVFQKAAEINNIDFGFENMGFFPRDDYTIETFKQGDIPPPERIPRLPTRQELLDRYEKLLKGESIQIPGTEIPDNKAEEILHTLFFITNQYPFPIRVRETADGGVSIYGGRSWDPLTFDDIEKTKEWAKETEQLAMSMYWLSKTHRDTLQELLDIFQKKNEIMWKLKYPISYTYPSADNLIDKFRVTMDIAASVKLSIAQIESYKNSFPQNILFWLFLASIVIFLVSVLTPIAFAIYKTQNPVCFPLQLFALWIPSVYYLTVFCIVLVYLYKIIR